MTNYTVLTEAELQALLTNEQLERYKIERPELFPNVFKRPREASHDELSSLQAQVESLTGRVEELEKQLSSITTLTSSLQAAASAVNEPQPVGANAAAANMAPAIEEPAPVEEPIRLLRVETYGIRKKKR